ncbi:MAG: RelA/SpoT domain-containing protein [Bdellovibrionales bacterium]|nr:RelA/SpoT domain-containing protein [Bdellovibrionales bacterium]
MDNVDEVYKLLELYKKSKSKHRLNSLHDYIDNPKSDGYRSIHLVYKLKKEPTIFLEIQMRSKLQHMWATGVEVFGTLQNSSFKSGQGNKKWLEFFALLSSVFALFEGKPILKKHRKYSKNELLKKIKHLNHELKVLENLNVYTAVYKTVAKKMSSGRKGKYQLVVLDSREKTISYKTFGTIHFDEAANLYLELEQKHLNDDQVNIVLVNTGDIKKLEVSYPNYFMDTKELVQKISLIMMDKFL